MPAGFAVFSFGPIRPTDVPRLLVYVSRSRLTVRMGCCGTRMRSCGVCRRGSGGTFALGGAAWGASRCAAEVRNDGKHNSDGAHTRGTTPWALRPSRQPIILHPRRGCAKRKPSRTISRPESHHSCTTSQTTSATGPRKRRFPNAPTRKRQAGRIEQHVRSAVAQVKCDDTATDGERDQQDETDGLAYRGSNARAGDAEPDNKNQERSDQKVQQCAGDQTDHAV